MKSNPLKGAIKTEGDEMVSCEGASIEALLMGKEVFNYTRIVYDSPLKSTEELHCSCY